MKTIKFYDNNQTTEQIESHLNDNYKIDVDYIPVIARGDDMWSGVQINESLLNDSLLIDLINEL